MVSRWLSLMGNGWFMISDGEWWCLMILTVQSWKFRILVKKNPLCFSLSNSTDWRDDDKSHESSKALVSSAPRAIARHESWPPVNLDTWTTLGYTIALVVPNIFVNSSLWAIHTGNTVQKVFTILVICHWSVMKDWIMNWNEPLRHNSAVVVVVSVVC